MLYVAYGLPAGLHGRRPLNTPALIARYAELRTELGSREITRRDVFEHFVEKACAEAMQQGIGRASIKAFISNFSILLQRSRDGRIPTRMISDNFLNGTHIADAFLRTDLLILLDDVLRAEPDEAAEYIGSLEMNIEDALIELPTRAREPLFVGMLAMAVAALERDEPDRVVAIVDRLLISEEYEENEAGVRIVAELRDHDRLEPQIRAILRASTGNVARLFASNVTDLIQDLRLPLERRLNLILEMEGDEDSDDWRIKYWIDPEAAGRLITTFARVAAAAVREDPAVSAPLLVERFDAPGARPDIYCGLLLEAGAIDPEATLNAAWNLHFSAYGHVFDALAYLYPKEAARQVVVASQLLAALQPDVAELLWRIARKHKDVGGNSHQQALAEAATALLPKTTNSREAAQLKLTIALAGPLDEAAQADLLRHWGDMYQHEVWSLIVACPKHLDQLLDKIFTEIEVDGRHGKALEYLIYEIPWDPLVARLEKASRTDQPRTLTQVASAVEQLLYRDAVHNQKDERLRSIARSLAASAIKDVRRPILFFAGSPMRSSMPAADRIAFRDELLQILVDHEDGSTLETLVWKLGESALERGGAAERLLSLCERLGTTSVKKYLREPTFWLAKADSVIDDLQLLLTQRGLPGLTDNA